MNNIDLSTRLKELRKTYNFSQEYVASHLNISRQAYSHYETGRNTPPLDMLIKLSQLYHLPTESFVSVSSSPTAASSISQQSSDYLNDFLAFFNTTENQSKYRHLSEEEKLLIYFFHKLPIDEQEDFLEILKIRALRNTQKKP